VISDAGKTERAAKELRAVARERFSQSPGGGGRSRL